MNHGGLGSLRGRGAQGLGSRAPSRVQPAPGAPDRHGHSPGGLHTSHSALVAGMKVHAVTFR